MNLQLIKASLEYKQVISNLMQFYMYDFSEYTNHDVGPNGLFGAYHHLEDYWEEENRFPYIIRQDDIHVGFVFVRAIEEQEKSYFSIAEFFILRKYRRKGLGRLAAEQVFNMHIGDWEVYQLEANKPANTFWRKVILNYTKGQFKERIENKRTIQSFDNR
jgi:predicted acetyltransferase